MSRQSAIEFPTVEVVNTVERRRWPLAKTLRIVEESLLPSMSVSFVARKHGVAPNLLFRWRKLLREGGKTAVQADDQVVRAYEFRALKKQVRELERLLGKETMEVEILKDAIEIARTPLTSRTIDGGDSKQALEEFICSLTNTEPPPPQKWFFSYFSGGGGEMNMMSQVLTRFPRQEKIWLNTPTPTWSNFQRLSQRRIVDRVS